MECEALTRPECNGGVQVRFEVAENWNILTCHALTIGKQVPTFRMHCDVFKPRGKRRGVILQCSVRCILSVCALLLQQMHQLIKTLH